MILSTVEHLFEMDLSRTTTMVIYILIRILNISTIYKVDESKFILKDFNKHGPFVTNCWLRTAYALYDLNCIHF